MLRRARPGSREPGGGAEVDLPHLPRHRQGKRIPIRKAKAKSVVRVELATSSYRQFGPGMGVPVRITLGKPRFRLSYSYEEIRLLAPTPRIFRLGGGDFDHEYRKHLEKIGVERLETIFEDVAGRHDSGRLILLCFENVLAGESCHRRSFARWWEEQTGEAIPELNPEDYQAQKRLF